MDWQWNYVQISKSESHWLWSSSDSHTMLLEVQCWNLWQTFILVTLWVGDPCSAFIKMCLSSAFLCDQISTNTGWMDKLSDILWYCDTELKRINVSSDTRDIVVTLNGTFFPSRQIKQSSLECSKKSKRHSLMIMFFALKGSQSQQKQAESAVQLTLLQTSLLYLLTFCWCRNQCLCLI